MTDTFTFVHIGTPSQQAITKAAIAACDYPFARLTKPVTIAWRDLSADGALGLYYPGRYRIEVHTGVESNALLAKQVTVAEAWHAVDDQAVTDAMRTAIANAWHPAGPDGHQWDPGTGQYADWIGEAMMFGFSLAFAPTLGVSGLDAQFTHKATPDVAAEIRRILLGTQPPPPSGGDADTAFASVLTAWLDRGPRYYRPVQSAARAWLASRTA